MACDRCDSDNPTTPIRRAVDGEAVPMNVCANCTTPADLPEDVYTAALAALPDGYGTT